MRKFAAVVAATMIATLGSTSAFADVIDFSQFSGHSANATFAGTTAGGVAFEISSATTLEARQQGNSWAGAFTHNQVVVFNPSTLPTVISFASAISSISNLGVQQDNYGAYTALLEAFDGSGNLLGSTSLDSISANDPGSLIGLSFAADGIRSIQLSVSNTNSGMGLGYALSPNGAVPEPASWAMMIAGFGIAGSAMRRRRTMVAFA